MTLGRKSPRRPPSREPAPVCARRRTRPERDCHPPSTAPSFAPSLPTGERRVVIFGNLVDRRRARLETENAKRSARSIERSRFHRVHRVSTIFFAAKPTLAPRFVHFCALSSLWQVTGGTHALVFSTRQEAWRVTAVRARHHERRSERPTTRRRHGHATARHAHTAAGPRDPRVASSQPSPRLE